MGSYSLYLFARNAKTLMVPGAGVEPAQYFYRGILSGSLASTPGYSLLVYSAIQQVFQRLTKRDHMPEFDTNRSGSLSRGSYLLLG